MSQRCKRSQTRLKGIIYAFLVIFICLFSELIWLQLIRGETLARKARDQRIEVLGKTPLRGTIYDRNMQVLAGTFHEPAIVIFPRLVADRNCVAKLLPIGSDLSELSAQSWIYLDSNKANLESLSLEQLNDPGIAIIGQPVRYDPKGLAAHVIGYLDDGDISGVSGIEKVFDAYLRTGETGLIVSFVDARRVPYQGIE